MARRIKYHIIKYKMFVKYTRNKRHPNASSLLGRNSIVIDNAEEDKHSINILILYWGERDT